MALTEEKHTQGKGLRINHLLSKRIQNVSHQIHGMGGVGILRERRGDMGVYGKAETASPFVLGQVG